MEEAIAKAGALIEAMEYIRRFRGRIVVVKLGGSVLEDSGLQKKLLTDIAFMATVGMQPIIVHGGGKAITKAMNEAGLEPVWVQGRRYTDERTLTIAEHTLVHKINTPICETLTELNCKPMGLHSLSSCILFAEPLRLASEDGRKLDLGLVGQIIEINAHLLKTLCADGTIPVIASIAKDKVGGKLNVNADSAAGKAEETMPWWSPPGLSTEGSEERMARMRERWEDMSEEQRERFRDGMRERKERWENMSEEERQEYLDRMRERRERWRNMSEEERQEFRARRRERRRE
ncbi:Acetylglutamate kinase [subsurface metagenome]